MQLKKKFYLREAVDLYTKGLDMGSALPQLLSLLQSNRAQAHIMLGNWRNALQDSQRAIQLDAHNWKVPLHPPPCPWPQEVHTRIPQLQGVYNWLTALCKLQPLEESLSAVCVMQSVMLGGSIVFRTEEQPVADAGVLQRRQGCTEAGRL